MPWVTLVSDVLLINLAFMIAYWLRYVMRLFRSVDPANNVPYSVYLPMVTLLRSCWCCLTGVKARTMSAAAIPCLTTSTGC